jgi:hypothetical protein
MAVFTALKVHTIVRILHAMTDSGSTFTPPSFTALKAYSILRMMDEIVVSSNRFSSAILGTSLNRYLAFVIIHGSVCYFALESWYIIGDDVVFVSNVLDGACAIFLTRESLLFPFIVLTKTIELIMSPPMLSSMLQHSVMKKLTFVSWLMIQICTSWNENQEGRAADDNHIQLAPTQSSDHFKSKIKTVATKADCDPFDWSCQSYRHTIIGMIVTILMSFCIFRECYVILAMAFKTKKEAREAIEGENAEQATVSSPSLSKPFPTRSRLPHMEQSRLSYPSSSNNKTDPDGVSWKVIRPPGKGTYLVSTNSNIPARINLHPSGGKTNGVNNEGDSRKKEEKRAHRISKDAEPVNGFTDKDCLVMTNQDHDCEVNSRDRVYTSIDFKARDTQMNKGKDTQIQRFMNSPTCLDPQVGHHETSFGAFIPISKHGHTMSATIRDEQTSPSVARLVVANQDHVSEGNFKERVDATNVLKATLNDTQTNKQKGTRRQVSMNSCSSSDLLATISKQNYTMPATIYNEQTKPSKAFDTLEDDSPSRFENSHISTTGKGMIPNRTNVYTLATKQEQRPFASGQTLKHEASVETAPRPPKLVLYECIDQTSKGINSGKKKVSCLPVNDVGELHRQKPGARVPTPGFSRVEYYKEAILRRGMESERHQQQKIAPPPGFEHVRPTPLRLPVESHCNRRLKIEYQKE